MTVLVATRHRDRLRRTTRLVIAAAVAACASLVLGPVPAHAAAAGGGVTRTKTVTRYFIDDGKKTTVDKRTVTVKVDTTTNLRSLQLVHVSWSGARPTAGIVGDPNSDLAQNEEYSMVLLECRGVDSTKVPVAKRISPQTCWTQFADERNYYPDSGGAWPAWRSDAVAATSQRAARVGVPHKLNSQCQATLGGTEAQYWVPFKAADGQVFDGGPFGCAGQPPEAATANFSSLSLPSNETFGVTDLDGKGEANFDIFTGEDHSSLGCSQTVPCSLVAIPIIGINCDAAGTKLPVGKRPSPGELPDAQAHCEAKGNFTAGTSIPPAKSGADAVDGRLWWSASNWNNRITFPLTFAPPDDACAVVGGGTPINVYGSELLTQATTQWAPIFCLNPKLFDFSHVPYPEPPAANLVNLDSIPAAFVSRPPDGGFRSPTVMAPTSVTGFGIAFTVDDANGRPVVHLKLDARLLAKLLTESYPDTPFVQQNHYHLVKKRQVPDLQNNPLNITFDPEFQALNPDIPQRIKDSAATLLTLNSDSDVIYALTSYINSDPDARAWLNGKPDPWGMTVNPAYKGIKLPVQNAPLLDSYAAAIPQNNCFNVIPPPPFLPLVAAPTASMFSIGQDMEFSIAQSQTICSEPNGPTTTLGDKLVAQGRQQPGARFMLGTVSLGDAAREGLQLAELETHKSASAPDKFTNATGRTFVAPSTASLRAAAKLMTPDPSGTYWTLPYSAMRSNAADASAYPGTMPVYTAVQTRGVPRADAKDYATLIRYAAGRLQQPGTGQGKLPPGYLPMTSANGLGVLVNYALVAANAVAAQKGAVPALDATLPPPSHGGGSPSGAPTGTGPGGSDSGPGNGAGPGGAGGPGGPVALGGSGSGSTSSASSSASGSPGPSSSPSGTTSTPAAQAPAAYTQRMSTGKITLLIPILAGLVILLGAAVFFVRRYGRTGVHE